MAIEDWSSVAADNTTLGGISTDGAVTLVKQIDNMLRGMMAEVRTGIMQGQFSTIAYTTKAGNYTAVVVDRAALLDFTATATLSLTAAATLTSGWYIQVKATGGDVTVDPDGAELVNGLSSIVVARGMVATIVCTGTAFIAIATLPVNLPNAIINGDFNVWQRATSQTSGGYGSDDRWYNNHGGSTKVHSRQSHTLGQSVVPGNPQFYSRTVVTSVANAANFVVKVQNIEGVRTFSGQTITVTFWAKADASRNIAIEMVQNFGTGGSPSAPVTGLGSQLKALTTSFAKYQAVISLPSVSGKTLGSNGNDYLQFAFWFDAGSNYNLRTASLGQQSGTFDISHVSIVLGDASGEADPFETRDIMQEEHLCYRFFEKTACITSTNLAVWVPGANWEVRKRVAPSLTPVFDAGTGATFAAYSSFTTKGFNQTANHSVISTATVSGDAELV